MFDVFLTHLYQLMTLSNVHASYTICTCVLRLLWAEIQLKLDCHESKNLFWAQSVVGNIILSNGLHKGSARACKGHRVTS